jgi:hypothetical protein
VGGGGGSGRKISSSNWKGASALKASAEGDGMDKGGEGPKIKCRNIYLHLCHHCLQLASLSPRSDASRLPRLVVVLPLILQCLSFSSWLLFHLSLCPYSSPVRPPLVHIGWYCRGTVIPSQLTCCAREKTLGRTRVSFYAYQPPCSFLCLTAPEMCVLCLSKCSIRPY